MSFQKKTFIKDFYNIFYRSIKIERILVVTYSNRKLPSLTFFRPSLKSMIGPPIDIFFAYTAAGFSFSRYVQIEFLARLQMKFFINRNVRNYFRSESPEKTLTEGSEMIC